MAKLTDIVINAPRTFADKFVFAIAKVFVYLQGFIMLVSLVYTVWITLGFSLKLRELIESKLLSVLIVIGLIVIISLVALVINKLWLKNILGKPVFGDLGGLGRLAFFTAWRARPYIKVKLFEHEKPLATRAIELSNRLLQETLRERHEEICLDNIEIADIDSTETNEEISKEWKDIWEDKILSMTYGSQTFADFMDPTKLGATYAMASISRSAYIIPVVSALFWIIMIFLLLLFANNKMSLLTTVQLGLILNFISAALWHMFVLHRLNVLPIDFSSFSNSVLNKEEFSEELESLKGVEIHPKEFSVDRKYHQIIRGFQLKIMTKAMVSDISLLLILLGISHGLIFIIDPEYGKSIIDYHKILFQGVFLISIGMLCAFYLFSLLLENLRSAAAVVIVAVLAAGLPFLLDFILGGELDLSGARQAIFAGSGAIAGGLITAVTTRVKESMS